MQRILVTGAAGQLGTELMVALRQRYGSDAVLATDIRGTPGEAAGPFQRLDVTDGGAVRRAAADHEADTVFHLAAILSAAGERSPSLTWDVNIGGLRSVLEAARDLGCAIFTPSSIAAFGASTPADPAPQDTIQRPSTMYGITKVAGELLCEYYHSRFGVDTRGLRYPGLISYLTPPGGGTTDYAVEIFYAAVESGRYTCFLDPETRLDMLYMPDAIQAAIQLMETEAASLVHRNAFNVTAMQVTPSEIAAAIRIHSPGFEIEYEIDPVRQAIAESWPRGLDDSAARSEWGWNPAYDLASMTSDMLEKLTAKPQVKPVSEESR
ncbi:MAG: NAD-dependent epimerase/dehydratase family protein [Gemmatimonadota bacterium]